MPSNASGFNSTIPRRLTSEDHRQISNVSITKKTICHVTCSSAKFARTANARNYHHEMRMGCRLQSEAPSLILYLLVAGERSHPTKKHEPLRRAPWPICYRSMSIDRGVPCALPSHHPIACNRSGASPRLGTPHCLAWGKTKFNEMGSCKYQRGQMGDTTP